MEVRALLDLMRENKAAVQEERVRCEWLLRSLVKHLKTLSLDLAKEIRVRVELLQLIKSVEAFMATVLYM